MKTSRKADPAAMRLVHLRRALGFNRASDFARFLGVPEAQWSKFERGFPLSREVITLICDRIDGVSSAWIYFGKTDGLSDHLKGALGGA